MTATAIDNDAFVGVRTPVWNRIGVPAPEGATLMEAAEAANLLGWDLNLGRLSYLTPEGAPVTTDSYLNWYRNPGTGEVEAMKATGRPNESRPAIFTKVYDNLDNEAFLENITDICGPLLDGGATLYAIGAYGNNTVPFVAFDLGPIDLLDGDRYARFLTFITSHNGTFAFSGHRTATRLACTNMIANRAFAGGSVGHFNFRHTQSMAARIEDARDALRISDAYDKAMTVALERLADTPMTEKQTSNMVRKIWGPGSDDLTDRQKAALDSVDADIVALAFSGKTTEGYHGTQYGVFQAATEYTEWLAPRRPRDEGVAAWSAFQGPVANREMAVYKYLTNMKR